MESKVIKNLFCSEYLWDYLKDLKTVGVLKRDKEKKVIEIGVPKGIVASIIPTTNPTSTALFKSIISIKGRNTTVISPHPRAKKCIQRAAQIMHQAAVDAGAPEGCIGCLSYPTLEATHELMKHKYTSVILATGGSGLVKAAYSSGKPALGVGPGNAPAYIDPSADILHAVSAILMSQTFDWGTICSTEQSIVAHRIVAPRVLKELARQKAYICSPEEIRLLEKGIVGSAGHGLNAEIVGKSPVFIANLCGFQVPEDTTALVAPYSGIGRGYPLSMEKLSPILAFYECDSLEDGMDKCRRLLEYGGTGHTLAIHAQDEDVILEMSMALPAYRIVINSPTVQGAIGYATNLVPSMSLGCGAPGNNIIAQNINALDLIDIKRVAWVKEGFVKPLVSQEDGQSFLSRESYVHSSHGTGASVSQTSPIQDVALSRPKSPKESLSPLSEKEIESILKKANLKNKDGY
ncbi:MAG: aldehyde dehydrogenase family protein [Planctomycetota bacterium]|nr:MAG: aldehyde dehydrogenase family protein [Planctomycetota bacterium]